MLEVPSRATVIPLTVRANPIWWTQLRPDGRLFGGREPVPADVMQGDIGNCSVLAAVLSIAYHIGGTRYLKNMFKETSDGKVVCRLYDSASKPVYLESKKMICMKKDPRSVDDGTTKATPVAPGNYLWVSMIEVFCTAFTLAKDPGRYVLDAKNASFSRLGGVEVSNVLQCLLGAPAELKALPVPVLETVDGNKITRGKLDGDFQVFIDGPFGTLQYEQAVRKFVTGGTISVNDWKRNHSFNVRSRWRAFLHTMQSQVIRRSDFRNWVVRSAFDEPVKSILLAQENLFAQNLGAGNYSGPEVEYFKYVQQRIKDKKPVVIWTRERLGPSERRGHSAGEAMFKGLIANHAYAVKAVHAGSGREPPSLEIVNPWGGYTRAYSRVGRRQDGLTFTANEGDSSYGTFRLYLRDLMANFAYIASSTKAIAAV